MLIFAGRVVSVAPDRLFCAKGRHIVASISNPANSSFAAAEENDAPHHFAVAAVGPPGLDRRH
jgi:hypothetical protein